MKDILPEELSNKYFLLTKKKAKFIVTLIFWSLSGILLTLFLFSTEIPKEDVLGMVALQWIFSGVFMGLGLLTAEGLVE